MPNKSKAKGNTFERYVAEHLSSVFGLNFSRVPNSGAFCGGFNAFRAIKLTPAQQLLMVGDIIVPEQLSNYSIECKSYAKIPFHTFLSSNAVVDTWIEQAKTSNRNWFLIFKMNHTKGFVCFSKDTKVPYVYTDKSFISYKDVIIVEIEGFFEKNKELMLSSNIQNTVNTTS